MAAVVKISVAVVLSMVAGGAGAQTPSGEANPAEVRAEKARAELAKPLSNGDGTYVGEIRPFGAEACPDGWLPADGKDYGVGAPYSELFKVIADSWGSPKPGTFQVPDLRGVVLRGWNDKRADKFADPDIASRELVPGAPGYPSGNKNHVGTYQRDQFQTHRHNDSGHVHTIAGLGYHDYFACGERCGAITGGGQLTTTAVGANVTDPASLTAEEARFGPESRGKNAYVQYCIRNGKR